MGADVLRRIPPALLDHALKSRLEKEKQPGIFCYVLTIRLDDWAKGQNGSQHQIRSLEDDDRCKHATDGRNLRL
ncbi:hypothetical protein AB7187_21140, partial [Providencia rettgeri]